MVDSAVVYSVLIVFGVALGSFAGAQVWRLRARQLVEDMQAGEVVDVQEYETLLPLADSTFKTDRSRCLQCGTTLAWYDLVPLLSWLSTGGKCRYCKKPIGLYEPMMEIGVAVAFVLSYMFWPMPLDSGIGVAVLVLWLAAVVLLAILFAYDMKWFLLPDQVVFSLVGIGVLVAALKVANAPEMLPALISTGGAVLILSGLYFLLWYISRGRWVGFGDVKLGLGLALLLADWRLALLALFLANFIGSVVVVPGMLLGKLSRKTQVPFGPLLIAGAVIAMLAGERIIALYAGLLL